MSIRNNLTAIIFVLSTLLAKGQAQIWPFRDANGGVLRGNITGVVGEFRAVTGTTNARFHGGVDFTSPLPVTIRNNSTSVPNSGRAVFSMHAGTVAVEYLPSNCLNSYIRITLQDGSNVYYKHIKPSITNPVTNQTVVPIADGDQVQPGTFLGVMFGDVAGEGGCSVHVHINQNNGGGSLPGSTNFINQFVNPFNDTERPECLYPFGDEGTATDNSAVNGYKVAEFRRNPHTRTNTTNQLGESVRIDGIIHKNAYGKLDIVSRLRDIHIGLNGGRRPPPEEIGNSGINGASYEILDNAGRTVAAEVQNLNFNSVPLNGNANYVFDSRSNLSNHVYILTNNPTDANGRYDQFWNTGLRTGQTEDWDLTNRGNKDARSIYEAAYPDSKYLVRIRAKDITNFNGDAGILIRDVPTVIDNFLPYVKEVIVRQTSSIGPIVYYKVWNWDATTGQLNFTINDKPNDAAPLGKLWVKVVTSEPMKTLKLTISGNDPGPVIVDPTPVANTNNKEFVKEYNAIFGSGRQTITIAGTDLADNNLLTDPAQNSLRLADGTWPTSATQGTDTSHGFIIGTNTCASNFPGGRTDGTTCLYVEYSASSTNVATNEPVTFTPVVSGTGAITYNWNFGAGATPATATTVGPHMVVYNSTGTKSISLTVTDATGTKSKSGTLNVLTTSPSVDFSATPTSGVAPLTVYYSDRSAGTVSTRSWNFPGGNPSTSTSANPVVVYNIAGNYDATLVVNGTASTTKPGIVSVNSAQPLSATISHCSNYYFVNCSGGSYDQNQQVFFSTTVSGGMPFYSYQWNFGDGNTSTSSTPANIYSSLGNFTVTLVVTDRNGAKVTATTSLSVVTIFPFIDANFYASDTYIDTGDGPVTFTDATSSNVNPNRLTYYWDFGEGASPRYAYTKGPHTVCYFNIPITKEVYMRVHDPVSYKTDDHRLQINVVKSNVDQCTNYSPQWTTTSGAAAGAAIGTCLYPNETTGINNGNLSQLNCVLSTTSANTECVFDVTKSCFSDTWFQSHGNVMLRKEAKTYFNFAAAGLHDASRNYLATISEGIFYQHPENFKVGKRYVFTFFAKVRDLFHWRIDHLKISLATGLVPSVDNCNRGLEIYQPPTYPFSLHQLGSFDYAINSKFELKCFEVYFYPPNNNFNQIWIYPDVEASLLNRVGTQVDQRILITDFSLRSGNSGDNFYCAPDIIVKNSVPGLTQSSITLKTQGTVNLPSGQTTTYRAGEVITLKPGFSAASGSVFKASIGSCTGSSGREDALIPSAPTFDDYDLFRQDYRTPNQFTGLLVLAPDRSEIEDEYLLTVTPSPANDKITVRSTLKQQSSIEISIVSLVGVVVDNRLISETKNIEEEFAIRLLSPGVYFVRIKSSEGVVVRKFVKL
jgi:PKD repeat protein